MATDGVPGGDRQHHGGGRKSRSPCLSLKRFKTDPQKTESHNVSNTNVTTIKGRSKSASPKLRPKKILQKNANGSPGFSPKLKKHGSARHVWYRLSPKSKDRNKEDLRNKLDNTVPGGQLSDSDLSLVDLSESQFTAQVRSRTSSFDHRTVDCSPTKGCFDKLSPTKRYSENNSSRRCSKSSSTSKQPSESSPQQTESSPKKQCLEPPSTVARPSLFHRLLSWQSAKQQQRQQLLQLPQHPPDITKNLPSEETISIDEKYLSTRPPSDPHTPLSSYPASETQSLASPQPTRASLLSRTFSLKKERIASAVATTKKFFHFAGLYRDRSKNSLTDSTPKICTDQENAIMSGAAEPSSDGAAASDPIRRTSVQEWLNNMHDPANPGGGETSTSQNDERAPVAMETGVPAGGGAEASGKADDHDDLDLGAEAKMMVTITEAVKPPAQVTSSLLGAASGSPLRKLSGRPSVNWEDRFGLARQDSIDSAAILERIDSILQQRTGDPEEILTSLGFGSVERNDSLPSRIPERFLTRPSSAQGISVVEFLDKNPELKEYVNYRTALSQPSQSVSSSGDDVLELPVAGFAFHHAALVSSFIKRLKKGSYNSRSPLVEAHVGLTPTGKRFSSILHPDNTSVLCEQGVYEDSGEPSFPRRSTIERATGLSFKKRPRLSHWSCVVPPDFSEDTCHDSGRRSTSPNIVTLKSASPTNETSVHGRDSVSPNIEADSRKRSLTVDLEDDNLPNIKIRIEDSGSVQGSPRATSPLGLLIDNSSLSSPKIHTPSTGSPCIDSPFFGGLPFDSLSQCSNSSLPERFHRPSLVLPDSHIPDEFKEHDSSPRLSPRTSSPRVSSPFFGGRPFDTLSQCSNSSLPERFHRPSILVPETYICEEFKERDFGPSTHAPETPPYHPLTVLSSLRRRKSDTSIHNSLQNTVYHDNSQNVHADRNRLSLSVDETTFRRRKLSAPDHFSPFQTLDARKRQNSEEYSVLNHFPSLICDNNNYLKVSKNNRERDGVSYSPVQSRGGDDSMDAILTDHVPHRPVASFTAADDARADVSVDSECSSSYSVDDSADVCLFSSSDHHLKSDHSGSGNITTETVTMLHLANAHAGHVTSATEVLSSSDDNRPCRKISSTLERLSESDIEPTEAGHFVGSVCLSDDQKVEDSHPKILQSVQHESNDGTCAELPVTSSEDIPVTDVHFTPSSSIDVCELVPGQPSPPPSPSEAVTFSEYNLFQYNTVPSAMERTHKEPSDPLVDSSVDDVSNEVQRTESAVELTILDEPCQSVGDDQNKYQSVDEMLVAEVSVSKPEDDVEASVTVTPSTGVQSSRDKSIAASRRAAFAKARSTQITDEIPMDEDMNKLPIVSDQNVVSHTHILDPFMWDVHLRVYGIFSCDPLKITDEEEILKVCDKVIYTVKIPVYSCFCETAMVATYNELESLEIVHGHELILTAAANVHYSRANSRNVARVQEAAHLPLASELHTYNMSYLTARLGTCDAQETIYLPPVEFRDTDVLRDRPTSLHDDPCVSQLSTHLESYDDLATIYLPPVTDSFPEEPMELDSDQYHTELQIGPTRNIHEEMLVPPVPLDFVMSETDSGSFDISGINLTLPVLPDISSEPVIDHVASPRMDALFTRMNSVHDDDGPEQVGRPRRHTICLTNVNLRQDEGASKDEILTRARSHTVAVADIQIIQTDNVCEQIVIRTRRRTLTLSENSAIFQNLENEGSVPSHIEESKESGADEPVHKLDMITEMGLVDDNNVEMANAAKEILKHRTRSDDRDITSFSIESDPECLTIESTSISDSEDVHMRDLDIDEELIYLQSEDSLTPVAPEIKPTGQVFIYDVSTDEVSSSIAPSVVPDSDEHNLSSYLTSSDTRDGKIDVESWSIHPEVDSALTEGRAKLPQDAGDDTEMSMVSDDKPSDLDLEESLITVTSEVTQMAPALSSAEMREFRDSAASSTTSVVEDVAETRNSRISGSDLSSVEVSLATDLSESHSTEDHSFTHDHVSLNDAPDGSLLTEIVSIDSDVDLSMRREKHLAEDYTTVMDMDSDDKTEVMERIPIESQGTECVPMSDEGSTDVQRVQGLIESDIRSHEDDDVHDEGDESVVEAYNMDVNMDDDAVSPLGVEDSILVSAQLKKADHVISYDISQSEALLNFGPSDVPHSSKNSSGDSHLPSTGTHGKTIEIEFALLDPEVEASITDKLPSFPQHLVENGSAVEVSMADEPDVSNDVEGYVSLESEYTALHSLPKAYLDQFDKTASVGVNVETDNTQPSPDVHSHEADTLDISRGYVDRDNSIVERETASVHVDGDALLHNIENSVLHPLDLYVDSEPECQSIDSQTISDREDPSFEDLEEYNLHDYEDTPTPVPADTRSKGQSFSYDFVDDDDSVLTPVPSELERKSDAKVFSYELPLKPAGRDIAVFEGSTPVLLGMDKSEISDLRNTTSEVNQELDPQEDIIVEDDKSSSKELVSLLPFEEAVVLKSSLTAAESNKESASLDFHQPEDSILNIASTSGDRLWKEPATYVDSDDDEVVHGNEFDNSIVEVYLHDTPTQNLSIMQLDIQSRTSPIMFSPPATTSDPDFFQDPGTNFGFLSLESKSQGTSEILPAENVSSIDLKVVREVDYDNYEVVECDQAKRESVSTSGEDTGDDSSDQSDSFEGEAIITGTGNYDIAPGLTSSDILVFESPSTTMDHWGVEDILHSRSCEPSSLNQLASSHSASSSSHSHSPPPLHPEPASSEPCHVTDSDQVMIIPETGDEKVVGIPPVDVMSAEYDGHMTFGYIASRHDDPDGRSDSGESSDDDQSLQMDVMEIVSIPGRVSHTVASSTDQVSTDTTANVVPVTSEQHDLLVSTESRENPDLLLLFAPGENLTNQEASYSDLPSHAEIMSPEISQEEPMQSNDAEDGSPDLVRSDIAVTTSSYDSPVTDDFTQSGAHVRTGDTDILDLITSSELQTSSPLYSSVIGDYPIIYVESEEGVKHMQFDHAVMRERTDSPADLSTDVVSLQTVPPPQDMQVVTLSDVSQTNSSGDTSSLSEEGSLSSEEALTSEPQHNVDDLLLDIETSELSRDVIPLHHHSLPAALIFSSPEEDEPLLLEPTHLHVKPDLSVQQESVDVPVSSEELLDLSVTLEKANGTDEQTAESALAKDDPGARCSDLDLESENNEIVIPSHRRGSWDLSQDVGHLDLYDLDTVNPEQMENGRIFNISAASDHDLLMLDKDISIPQLVFNNDLPRDQRVCCEFVEDEVYSPTCEYTYSEMAEQLVDSDSEPSSDDSSMHSMEHGQDDGENVGHIEPAVHPQIESHQYHDVSLSENATICPVAGHETPTSSHDVTQRHTYNDQTDIQTAAGSQILENASHTWDIIRNSSAEDVISKTDEKNIESSLENQMLDTVTMGNIIASDKDESDDREVTVKWYGRQRDDSDDDSVAGDNDGKGDGDTTSSHHDKLAAVRNHHSNEDETTRISPSLPDILYTLEENDKNLSRVEGQTRPGEGRQGQSGYRPKKPPRRSLEKISTEVDKKRKTLGEMTEVQSFELEEIQSEDTMGDDLPSIPPSKPSAASRGVLVRTGSAQSDSSGFAEADPSEIGLPSGPLDWQTLKIAHLDSEGEVVGESGGHSNQEKQTVASRVPVSRESSRTDSCHSCETVRWNSKLVESSPSFDLEQWTYTCDGVDSGSLTPKKALSDISYHGDISSHDDDSTICQKISRTSSDVYFSPSDDNSENPPHVTLVDVTAGDKMGQGQTKAGQGHDIDSKQNGFVPYQENEENVPPKPKERKKRKQKLKELKRKEAEYLSAEIKQQNKEFIENEERKHGLIAPPSPNLVTKLYIKPPPNQSSNLSLNHVSELIIEVDDGQIKGVQNVSQTDDENDIRWCVEYGIHQVATEEDYSPVFDSIGTENDQFSSKLDVSAGDDVFSTASVKSVHSDSSFAIIKTPTKITTRPRSIQSEIDEAELLRDPDHQVSCLHLSVMPSPVDAPVPPPRWRKRPMKHEINMNGCAQHEVLSSMIKHTGAWDSKLESLPSRQVWKRPPAEQVNIDYKQYLLDQMYLLQHALQKYKAEFEMLTRRSNMVFMQEEVPPEQRSRFEDLFMFSEAIMEEIDIMESALEDRMKTLSETTYDSANYFMDLSSLNMLREMIELMKEQVYHGNVVTSMEVGIIDEDERSSAAIETASSAAGSKPASAMVPDARSLDLMAQLTLMQQELLEQQNRAASQLTESIKELRGSLLEEIRKSIKTETKTLRTHVKRTERHISSLKRQISSEIQLPLEMMNGDYSADASSEEENDI